MARRVLPAHARRVMWRWDEVRYVEQETSCLRLRLIIIADYLFTNMAYTPSQPHNKPALLQATIELPPHETVHLSLRVHKAFLRYQEHRPDAQRGWDLPPAVFVPVDAPFRRIYTSALLVDLATPDFSMPYNVIIMSSTLIALVFGSLFNMLIRRFVVVNLDDEVSTSTQ
jgi:phosphatidylinositol glycan class T